MTDYVLEILDGETAGDIFELTETPVTIGRRKGNHVIINDEKVSGRHAEIVREDDQFLLKDLNSTNGTLMDGRPITEMALSPNDIVRIGRIRVAFKEKGAPTPGGDDMHVRKLDAETLAKTRRRGTGIGVLLVLVLVLAGGGFWYMRSGITNPAQVTNPRRIPRVAGNMLPKGMDSVEGMAQPAGDAEGDDSGWNRAVSGVEFERVGPAHTGRLALVATYPVPEAREAGTGDVPRHALARTAREFHVVSGQSLKVGAFLATTGGARISLRLRFTSSTPDDDLVLTAGIRPQAYHGYTKVEAEVAVPPDVDQVQLEVLALLPNQDSEAQADDFALLQGGTAKPHELRTSNGFRLVGSDGAVALKAPTKIVMTAMGPATAPAALAGLDDAGLLALADAGAELRVTGSDQGKARGYAIEVGGISGVRLDFHSDVGAAGVLARKGNAPFATYANKFRVEEVDNVLLGRADSRVMLYLPTPGSLVGEGFAGGYRLILPHTTSLHLITSFVEKSRSARRARTEAEQLVARGDYDKALVKLAQVLEQFPHDVREASQARQLRARLRNEQNAWMDRLQGELDDARFFGTRGGFVKVEEGLAALHDKFGAAHLLQKERFHKMQQDVRERIRQLDQEQGERERARLESLVTVFEANGQKQLKELVQQYIQEHLPPAGAGGDNTKKEGR